MTCERMSLFLQYENNYWVFRKNSVQEMTSNLRMEPVYELLNAMYLQQGATVS
jgi:hypothetical protein